jgi:2,4-dienoyl-CoA reductase-like NADH-dependent reductase (Old Yellow Enzyme family)
MTDFGPLFTPMQLGKFTLPNRFVFPPMGLEVCENGIPGDDAAEYYARRAQGGASLVMTEGAYIDHPSSGDNPLLGRIRGEDSWEAWRNVATKVHREGGLCVPELWHVGLIPCGPDLLAGKGIVFRPELGQVSPSGYIAPGQKVTEGMTQAEIDEVIAAYARSTAKSVELGFDGIELHGAHGYVIDQFLWKELNHRTDRYGGSPRARGQFAADVVRACRAALEPGMPVIVRTSFWKMVDFEARLADSPQELEDLFAPMVEAGVDLFDCSQRRFWEPVFPADESGGSDLNLAGWVKKVTGVPTCTIGSIGLDTDFFTNLAEGKQSETETGRLDDLMRRFNRGDFDMVAVGRAMIAEPDWPKLVQAGRLDKLRPFSPSIMADPLLGHLNS